MNKINKWNNTMTDTTLAIRNLTKIEKEINDLIKKYEKVIKK